MAMRGWAARGLAAAALMATGLAQAQSSNEDFVPVTDAMIQNPDPADWLSWRRTLDSWGYSPLDEINKGNVDQLRLVWVRPLEAGHQEGTPLVHDGRMFFPGPSDMITALDAASGDVLWTHKRSLPKDMGQYLTFPDTNRNLAIYGDLIIARGSDDHIYAVNALTGKLAWDTKILDYRKGAKQSSGPIIAEGLAITGRSCEPEGGPDACVITAHDARTGKEVWRTSTIARGDDPNDKTWGGTPLEKRTQVGAWMNASYDPELHLLYMGTSVSAPTPKFLLAGNDHTYLYHNSTLALDVKTGKIVWHYQHIVDHWDLDHPFPRILLDETVAPDPKEVTWINPKIVKGKTYKVVTGVPGKTGVVYTLDRTTGEFLWARPTVQQNVVQSIDGRTGKVTVNPETEFERVGQERYVCPSSTGGANYQAPAYSPLTKTMYFPEQNLCETVSAVEPDWNNLGYSISSKIFIPPEADKKLGVIHAIDAVTGKTNWTYSIRAGMQSLLTTGGGLLFGGDSAGRFRAMDQQTGKVLWEMNLGSAVTGYPITFSTGGHQYVAVSTGFWLGDSFTPEILKGTQGTLFVFALPDAGIGRKGPDREPVDARAAPIEVTPPKADSAPGAGAAAVDGQALYTEHCSGCHGGDYQGGAGIPPVRGAAFMANWKGKSADQLHAYLKTAMPPGAAGTLSDAEYRAIAAHILKVNAAD
ncbi:outer membrane protein assembly factor BamB family protein [Croceibacterium aestuarii]|uniref:outer membrane protein assembly factor BamB family protein n=1 Tax=Croceibacterium aestuarii TaxID=3064139 RepID=UPI00272EBF49|nr:PQQ-binding-like beta-propeller repeat protein [Croceibacterium sp. D39]